MNTDIQGIWTAAADRACRGISGDIQEYALMNNERDFPESESSSITDGKFNRNSSSLFGLNLDNLNYDVLRNIFDRLNLSDIVSVQRVCTRFEDEAHYYRASARFELHSVVMRRFGDPINWLAESNLILQQYGQNITDLDANYNCFPGRGAIDNLSENVRVFCTHLEIYSVNGSLRYPDISAGQLLRPNLQALHTLRLCNFSRSTTDLDVAVYLVECKGTLRTLHVENMHLTGEFLLSAPDTLESLELIKLDNIETNYIIAYLRRNPALKRLELVTRGFHHCFPNTEFYLQIAQVQHLRLQIDNRSPTMFPLDVGPLRNLMNLKSLEIDACDVFNLRAMFAGLTRLPILERLTITPICLDAIIYQSLKALKKLQYLKVKFQTQAIAEEIESLILSVSEAVGLTELDVESKYGGNLLPIFTYLPNLQKVKLYIAGCYTNLKNMAYVRHLSNFEVRLGGASASNAIREFIGKLEELRPIKRLTVTLLSSTEFLRDMSLKFEELAEVGIKSFITRDAYEISRIAEGRTFEVQSDALRNVRLITALVEGRNCFETYEFVITGEVGAKYSQFDHTRNCKICSS